LLIIQVFVGPASIIRAGNFDIVAGDVPGLIAAINSANDETNYPGPDTINLGKGTYDLLTAYPAGGSDDGLAGLPAITSEITIFGNGATLRRASQIGEEFRIITILNTGKLTVTNLTIKDGRLLGVGPALGGGIANEGELTLINSTVSNNLAGAAAGILNSGTLVVNTSVITENFARFTAGGIRNEGGTVNVINSSISNNREGAAIVNWGGRVTVTNSTINDNEGFDPGYGGIVNSGWLEVVNSTISGNSSQNVVGGIANFDTAVIRNSTITGNSSAPDYAGGIHNSAGTIELINTIVANQNSDEDCSGVVTSLGYNLDSDGTCQFTGPGDLPGVDPLLASLANNGGPTQTHALLSGSPAIDAGSPDYCPDTDQRGESRPSDGNGDGTARCDIGAYEEQQQPPTCSEAKPSVNIIWPPDHKFVPVEVIGVTDADGDEITIIIDSIFQDEPVDSSGDGSFAPDGQGVGTPVAEVRAERVGTKKVPGNGRVYHIGFSATDENGGSCSGTVLVGVPHDKKNAPVDDGALYDSTSITP
jgi:hypothetical protein